jgi:hypothetical protein
MDSGMTSAQRSRETLYIIMTKEQTDEKIHSFYTGKAEGISLYAHWKDGVQYVGTTGKTLAKALESVAAEYSQSLERNERTHGQHS